MCDGGEIMAVRGWWRQNYGWLWMVVGGWGKIMAGRVWSWMVSRFSNARDLFILMDSIITNTHSRRNHPPLSLIMTNIVYLIREMTAITLRNVLKHDLNHSLNTL